MTSDETSRQPSRTAMRPSGRQSMMLYLLGMALYFVFIFLLPSIMVLLRADPYWLNSTLDWDDHDRDNRVLSWLLFVLDE